MKTVTAIVFAAIAVLMVVAGHQMWLTIKASPPVPHPGPQLARIPLTRNQQQQRNQLLSEYGMHNLPAVMDAIQSLKSADAESQRQISFFTNTVSALGIDPANDPRFQAAVAYRIWLAERRCYLESQLEDLFVYWSKYLNMPIGGPD